MKLGTRVKLPDGRVGTVVYNSLIGVGIKWGIHNPSMDDFAGTSGNCLPLPQDSPAQEPDWPWQPDALLRAMDMSNRLALECVGDNYEVLEQ